MRDLPKLRDSASGMQLGKRISEKDKVLNKYFGISVNVLTNHKNIWQPGTRSIWEVPRSEACSRPDLGRGNTLPILTPCSPEF